MERLILAALAVVAAVSVVAGTALAANGKNVIFDSTIPSGGRAAAR